MIRALVVLAMFVSSGTALAQAKPKDEKKVEPAPAAADHVYAPAGKRDPFQEREVKVVFPPSPPNCGTLCQFDVEQFKVSAVVTGTSTPLAGLEAPNGKVYIVDRGTVVGKRNGRVVEVLAGKVVIEEPCAKELGKKCRTELVLAAEPKASDEDLQRKKK